MNLQHSWGKPTTDQMEAMRPFLHGKEVRDYGCGHMVLSLWMIGMGVTHVHAIDKERRPIPLGMSHRISFTCAHFKDIPTSNLTAFVSWPYTDQKSLLHLQLRYAETVIYLGTNFAETHCGYPQLYAELSRREVHHYIPDKKNNLIIYGKERIKRPILPEEYAGLHACLGEMYSFDDLHRKKRLRVSSRLKKEYPHLLIE